MPRILSVWLPSWPTQRLHRLRGAPADAAPLATVVAVRGMRRLAAVCPRAAAIGLQPGQALAEARAICPGLDAVDADADADRAGLAALAAWCERLTPLAASDPPDGLWLDIAGCDHLFGGEAALAEALAARLAQASLLCRIAIACTTGAAWALARSATSRAAWTVCPPGEERAALELLPAALLRIEDRAAAGLRRLGLRTIGEIARLPRADLAARFGAPVLTRLDQALGRAAEAIAWPRPPVAWEERLAFLEPIGTAEDFARALDLLTRRLCARLEAAGRGGRRFVATFYRVDDERPQIAIGTALPVRDAAAVTKLLAAKIETVDPGFGVEVIALEVAETDPLRTPQAVLGNLAVRDDAGRQNARRANTGRGDKRREDIGREHTGREDTGREDTGREDTGLAAVVDEIANRLGEDRLWRSAPAPSHVPERAVRRVPPLAARPAWEADPSAERPVRLFRRPEPIEATAPVPDDPPILFRWRGALHRVRAADGPERISAEWWKREDDAERPETDRVRDYYRVEDSAGARFWIFRAGLHRGAVPPRWFLHGLFG